MNGNLVLSYFLMRKHFLRKQIVILLVFLLPFTSLVNAMQVFGNDSLTNIIDDIVLKDTNGNVLDKDTSVGLDDVVHVFIKWSIKEDQVVHANESLVLQLPEAFKIYNEVTGDLITNQTKKATTPQTGEGTTSQTGEATTPQTGEGTTSQTGEATTPQTGETTTPQTGEGTTSQTGEATTPQTGEGTTSQTGEATTPQTGEATTPQTGEGTTSQTGEATTPQTGETTTPQTGEGTTSQTGEATTPQTGEATTPQVEKEINTQVKSATYTEGEESSTDQGDGSAGKFHVSESGLLTIIFNDFVEKHSLVSGEIQLSTHFNKEVISEKNTNIIIFTINENTKFEFVINFTPDNTTDNIIKSHTVDTYNPTEITWKIKVNKKLQTLSNMQINDVLSAGQRLIPESMKISKLHVNLDGTDTQTNETYEKFTLNPSENLDSFTLKFNDSIKDAYIIEYKTQMTDFKQQTFNNTATLTVDGTQYPTVQDSVTIQKRHLLEKLAEYDSSTNEVTWKVLVNYREAPLGEIGEIEVKDVWSEGQEFIENSIIVKEVTIDESGNPIVGDVVESTAYTVNKNNQGFSFFYNYENNSTKAFEITYKTKVTNPVNNSVKNVATLWDTKNNDKHIERYQKEISVVPPLPGEPVYLEKITTAKFDFDNRLQNWAITVNKAGATLAANTTITDTFPDGGMQFVRDSLVIKDGSGNIISSDEYEVTAIAGDTSWEKGFIITFKSPITTKYVISYQTKINPATHTPSGQKIQFKNVAVMNAVINEKSVTKEVVFNTTMNDRIVANGEKTGQYNYNDHSINWSILINEDESAISTPIVKDIISTDLEFVQESIEVHTVKMEYGGNYTKNTKVDSKMYDVVIKNNELTLQFKNSISDRYLITYKTNIKGITKSVYENIATINDGEEQLTQLKANVKVPIANKYVSKSGTQNGDTIDWSIFVNQSQSTIQNAVLHDEPSLGQKLLVESIKVFEEKFDGSNQSSTWTPIDQSLYNVTVNYDAETGAESFNIKFKDSINKTYWVKYSTKVTSLNGNNKLTNSATFSGDGVADEHSTMSSEIVVKITRGSGIASGVLGSVKVKKVDEEGNTLEGAEFTLYKDNVARTVITGEDGFAVFNDLLFGQYKLVETAAPEGYMLENRSYDVTINQALSPYEYTVINKVIPKEEEPTTPTPGEEPIIPEEEELTTPTLGEEPIIPEEEEPTTDEVETPTTEPDEGKLTLTPKSDEVEEASVPTVVPSTPDEGEKSEPLDNVVVIDNGVKGSFGISPTSSGNNYYIEEQSSNSSENDKEEKIKELPQTGETFLRIIFLTGLFFVAISSVFLRRKSK